MFERTEFTEKAYMVIVFARHECCPRRSRPVKAEHLLLGLLRADPNLFQNLLPGRNDIVANIRKELKSFTAQRIKSWSAPLPPPLSLAAQEVLTIAQDESKKMGEKLIGTEHILLGLLQSKKARLFGLIERGSSRASRILQDQGLRAEDVRARLSAGSITPQSQLANDLPSLGTLIS